MIPLPALLIRISRRSVLLDICSATSLTFFQSDRSHSIHVTFLAASSPNSLRIASTAPSALSFTRESIMSFSIPWERRVCVQPNPMPSEPPVTTATFPLREGTCSSENCWCSGTSLWEEPPRFWAMVCLMVSIVESCLLVIWGVVANWVLRVIDWRLGERSLDEREHRLKKGVMALNFSLCHSFGPGWMTGYMM